MTSFKYFLFVSFLISTSTLFSCVDESDQKNKSLVIGRWELDKAFRNNKQTETLAGTFFEFNESGKMSTNLPVGQETITDYEVKGTEIRQKGTKTLKYNIQSLTESQMILQIELRGMPFELQLNRMAPAVKDSISF
jgi:hypothetical protein